MSVLLLPWRELGIRENSEIELKNFNVVEKLEGPADILGFEKGGQN